MADNTVSINNIKTRSKHSVRLHHVTAPVEAGINDDNAEILVNLKPLDENELTMKHTKKKKKTGPTSSKPVEDAPVVVVEQIPTITTPPPVAVDVEVKPKKTKTPKEPKQPKPVKAPKEPKPPKPVKAPKEPKPPKESKKRKAPAPHITSEDEYQYLISKPEVNHLFRSHYVTKPIVADDSWPVIGSILDGYINNLVKTAADILAVGDTVTLRSQHIELATKFLEPNMFDDENKVVDGFETRFDEVKRLKQTFSSS